MSGVVNVACIVSLFYALVTLFLSRTVSVLASFNIQMPIFTFDFFPLKKVKVLSYSFCWLVIFKTYIQILLQYLTLDIINNFGSLNEWPVQYL